MNCNQKSRPRVKGDAFETGSILALGKAFIENKKIIDRYGNSVDKEILEEDIKLEFNNR